MSYLQITGYGFTSYNTDTMEVIDYWGQTRLCQKKKSKFPIESRLRQNPSHGR